MERSTIWKSFDKCNVNGDIVQSGYTHVKCRHCGELNAKKGNGTGNYWRHLRGQHPEEFGNLICIKDGSVLDDLDSKSNSKRKLDMLFTFGIISAGATSHRAIIENHFFRSLFKQLGYVPPCRKRVKRLSEDYCLRLRTELSQAFQDCTDLALSEDAYTLPTSGRNLLGIYAHLPVHDSKLDVLVDLVDLQSQTHTAENLQKATEKSVKEFKIDKKIRVLVTDGAAANPIVARNMNLMWVPCAAHRVANVVKHFSRCVTDDATLQKLRTAATSVRNSTVSRAAFKAAGGKLVPLSDCPTRWSSTFMMVTRAMSEIEAINCVLKGKNVDAITTEEAGLLGMWSEVLRPMKEATDRFCSSSSSVVTTARMWLTLKEQVKLLTTKYGGISKELLYSVERYHDEVMCPVIRGAMVFDVDLAFNEAIGDSHFWEEAKTCLVKIKDSIEGLISMRNMGLKGEGNKAELSNYATMCMRGDIRIEQGETMISCWTRLAKLFPSLGHIAKLLLCTPSGSVDVERLFSIVTRNLTDRRRSRMGSDNVCLYVKTITYYKNLREVRKRRQTSLFDSEEIKETEKQLFGKAFSDDEFDKSSVDSFADPDDHAYSEDEESDSARQSQTTAKPTTATTPRCRRSLGLPAPSNKRSPMPRPSVQDKRD